MMGEISCLEIVSVILMLVAALALGILIGLKVEE